MPVILPDNTPSFQFFSMQPKPNLAIHRSVGPIHCYPTVKVFPLCELATLLANPCNLKDCDEPGRYRLRFLLDTNFALWFAKAGEPDETTPFFYQMTGKPPQTAFCYAAGYLEFDSASPTKITGLCLKNYDFECQTSDLQWVLGILVQPQTQLGNIALAQTLFIEPSYSTLSNPFYFKVTLDQIRAWPFDRTILDSMRRQPREAKIYHYENYRPARQISKGEESDFRLPSPLLKPVSLFSSPCPEEQNRNTQPHSHSTSPK